MFESFMGRSQMNVFDDPLVRRACELWLDRVLAYYGDRDGGVDIEIIDGQLGLCAKTADHIYSGFTPRDIRYVPGSRPLLDAAVAEVVRPSMSQREKALAIMRRCRDNQDRGLAKPGLFAGGSEEELLKRGAIMCNEISRLFICLCQVAGLPARVHSAHISGHMMSEVLVDGKWWWIDSMKGLAPLLDSGEPASAWDLYRDPSLFERQSKSFWADCRPPGATFGTEQRDPRNLAFTMARNRDCYFNPKEAAAIGNYFAWDHARYSFPWHDLSKEPDREQRARHELLLVMRKLGWPDYYFCANLFDEQLKMR